MDKRLWQTISTNYQKQNYTGAILDSIHFLGDLIREKANLESDGVALIGEAFGGNSPKIKVNKLQTESEKNVQKGLEQTLRGIYQMIRNPRSHSKFKDSQNDTDSIVIFIDFLSREIDKSKSSFSLDEIIIRVNDKFFLPTDEYAQLIVKEIPSKRRLETFLHIISVKGSEWSNIKNAGIFIKNLYNSLHDVEKFESLTALSEKLKHTYDDNFLRLIVCAFGDHWTAIDEAVRLRIENRFIKAIEDGFYGRLEWTIKYNDSGSLATWIIYIVKDFKLKNQLFAAVCSKILSSKFQEKDFASLNCIPFLKYFEDLLPNPELENHFSKILISGNKVLYEALNGLPDSTKALFKSSIESFKEKQA
ncbi:MAG: TIGR02391 family protein [Saprospiraceae bacterium]